MIITNAMILAYQLQTTQAINEYNIGVLLSFLLLLGGVWKFIDHKLSKLREEYDSKIITQINTCRDKCNMKFDSYDTVLKEYKNEKDKTSEKLDLLDNKLTDMRISLAEILTFIKGTIPDSHSKD